MLSSLALLFLVGGASPAGLPVDAIANIDRGGDQTCTGTLISDRVVVTAAHCIDEDARPEELSLRVGGERVGAVRLVVHPGWVTGGNTDDVGLIVLAHSVEAAPVEIAAIEAEIGLQVTVAGWGRREMDAPGSAGTLRSGSMLVSRADPDASVLLKPVDAVLCKGDSGGPTFVAGQLVGIHQASDCSTASRDMVAAEYADWIHSHAATVPTVAAPAGGCAAGGNPQGAGLLLAMVFPLLLCRRCKKMQTASRDDSGEPLCSGCAYQPALESAGKKRPERPGFGGPRGWNEP